MWFSASLKKPVFYPEVMVNDKVLEVVDTQLYLGLMFDSIGCHGRINFLMCARRCLILQQFLDIKVTKYIEIIANTH